MPNRISRPNPPQPPPPTVTGLVLDPFFTHHDPGGDPESPLRMNVIKQTLADTGLLQKLAIIRPRDAEPSDIQLVHTPLYFRTVKNDIQFGAGYLSTGDTTLSESSLDVALRATGGLLEAVDTVMRGLGGIKNVFCAVRPPGHHATPVAGMGFCIFNHVAVAARYAQLTHKLEKILIVDWDVHHGNGTQEIFYDDDTVLFFSCHQHPLYPGTGKRSERGRGRGKGYTVNAPLPPGSGFKEISAELDKLEKKVRKFKPELILISAGFDARLDDPLGDFTLTDADFAKLTQRMVAWSNEFAQGRLISSLEGGYNLQTLGGAVAAHIEALAMP